MKLFALYDCLAFSVGNWRILCGVAWSTATGNASHAKVGVCIQKKGNRITRLIAGIVVGEMLDADEAIIGPGAQQLTGVHDEGIFEQGCLYPLLATFAEDSETGSILCQDRAKSSIDMGRDTEFIDGHILLWRVVRHAQSV